MDSKAAAYKVDDAEIRKHCYVNTNKDGDRFVGIKADSNMAMVYFPIGYQLPETDQDIRADIRNLIQILAEFKPKKNRLIAVDDMSALQESEFPIHAYRSVIEYYFSTGGKYYVETEQVFRSSSVGRPIWTRTIRNQTPLVQCTSSGECSFIYTDFTIRSSLENENKMITQINKYCVYEAFNKLGWLYVPFMPDKPEGRPQIKKYIQVVRKNLARINDDRKKKLFRSMLDILEYMDQNTYEYTFFYGTDDFEDIWEKLIDRVFGESNKEKYFPRSRWLLDYEKNKEKRSLRPDSIMIYKNKYYVLDAKYYRYGCTGNSDHLPNAASINKQITYGEYLEKECGISTAFLFNAFIMPYNKMENLFKLTNEIENIGEAVCDWKKNKIYYERIQGILMDTRYLMKHYIGSHMEEKAALAKCIEKVMGRGKV